MVMVGRSFTFFKQVDLKTWAARLAHQNTDWTKIRHGLDTDLTWTGYRLDTDWTTTVHRVERGLDTKYTWIGHRLDTFLAIGPVAQVVTVKDFVK